jgi:hypothetical protein
LTGFPSSNAEPVNPPKGLIPRHFGGFAFFAGENARFSNPAPGIWINAARKGRRANRGYGLSIFLIFA